MWYHSGTTFETGACLSDGEPSKLDTFERNPQHLPDQDQVRVVDGVTVGDEQPRPQLASP